MEAIVLAGGKGTRLQSIVKDRPKPLAPMGNQRPFLDFLLDYLIHQGVSHIILSVGYKKEQIQSLYGQDYHGVKISYSQEDTPLLTGGAIRKAMELLDENSPFLVTNGDTFCPIDLKRAFAIFQEKKPSVLIPVKFVNDTSRYGRIIFSLDGRITQFVEKQKGSGFINVGSYILEREIDKTFSEFIFSFEKDFLERNYKTRNFYSMVVEDFFIDIGVPSDYVRACSYFC